MFHLLKDDDNNNLVEQNNTMEIQNKINRRPGEELKKMGQYLFPGNTHFVFTSYRLYRDSFSSRENFEIYNIYCPQVTPVNHLCVLFE